MADGIRGSGITERAVGISPASPPENLTTLAHFSVSSTILVLADDRLKLGLSLGLGSNDLLIKIINKVSRSKAGVYRAMIAAASRHGQARARPRCRCAYRVAARGVRGR